MFRGDRIDEMSPASSRPSLGQPSVSIPPTGSLPKIRYTRIRKGPWLQIKHPTRFEWNLAEIEIHDLPSQLEGFRIVHLTDLHTQPYWSDEFDELHDRLRSDPPGLVLVTGDYVENKFDPGPALPHLDRFLAGLAARHGVFGVRGNHDVNLWGSPLEQSHLKLIDGLTQHLHVGGAELELIGLPGTHRDFLDPSFIHQQGHRQPGRVRVVLSHFPDHFRRAARLQSDLYLTGHTHGGQLCLPWGQPLRSQDTLPMRYCRGIHRFNRTWFVANRGFGFSAWTVRLFCPAEVVELRLTRKLDG